MPNNSILFRKAAVYAAFFISLQQNAWAKPQVDTFENVKKKASSLLAQKQKAEALQTITDFIRIETNKTHIAEAGTFLIKLSQTFISKEAQDAYEASLNATLESAKEANKTIDICLQLEPQNIDCLIQKTRIAYREKNSTAADKLLEDVSVFTKATNNLFWIDLFLNKEANSNSFKNKNFIKKINEKPSEDFFILTILEIERSFMAKNFSRAKEGIEYLEKNYPDYPDTLYFKQKLDSESVEEKVTNSAETNLLYSTKCKSLTRTMARKFRYDFDLCQRGVQ